MKKIKISLLLLTSSLTLTSCEGIKKEDFLEKLFPDPWDALAVFLAFILLVVVVFFFAYKPVKALLKKRGDYVEGKIKDAEAKQAEATQILEDARNDAKQKKIESIELVEQAKRDAKAERQAILKKTQQEKQAELDNLKEQLAQEIEASKDEIHREIVSVAIDASSKVLEREVNKKDNEKLIDSFIDDLKENK